MNKSLAISMIFNFIFGVLAVGPNLHADDDTAQPNTDATDNAAWVNPVEGEDAAVIPAASDVAQPNTGATNNAAWVNPVRGEDAQPNIAEPNNVEGEDAQPNVDLPGY